MDYTADSPAMPFEVTFAHYARSANAIDPRSLIRMSGSPEGCSEGFAREAQSKIRSGFEPVTLLTQEQ